MGIFNKLLNQSTTTLSNPSQWFLNMFGGAQTHTGVRVTELSAMQSTAVAACVRVLSESVASLPLLTYQRLPEGGKQRAPNQPLYTLLHDIGNPEMSAFTLRETMQLHLSLWGNAYAEKEIDGGGRVRALWPLRPDRVQVWRDKETKQIKYTITIDGEQRTLPKWRVFHIPGLGFDGLVGLSPIGMAREAIGLSLATEEFGSRFFGNGTHFGGFLEHPNKLSEQAYDRLKRSIDDKSGLTEAHRLKILEEGMTFKQIGIPPEDAQFLETRKYQLNEIARIYRIPPHMIGDLDRATFSNVEQQSIDFVVHSLRPWLVRWEQAGNMQLLSKDSRKIYFIEHLIDGLLRGDQKSRYDAYAVGRQNGWLSANDVREMENMNPIDGGDEYSMNGNMIPIDSKGGENNG